MDEWFTVESIDRETFAVSEYKHWEEVHSYLICGTEKAVLIDTGLGVADIREAVRKLTDLPIEVLTTHVHWDHIGGHGQFEQIAVHTAEQAWISGGFPLPFEVVRKNLMGHPPYTVPQGFSAERYEVYQGGAQRLLSDGDRIPLGGRELYVVHTPGHSPGHCCFYEPGRNYLYAGDLIYSGCLDAFYPSTDPQLFWDSVKKVQKLQVNRVLPGHHVLEIPVGIIGRIEQAFADLAGQGELCQGNGIYEFEGFAIHI